MINESHPPLPTATFFGSQAVPEDTPLFTADQMRSYADATCALRGAQKESHAAPPDRFGRTPEMIRFQNALDAGDDE